MDSAKQYLHCPLQLALHDWHRSNRKPTLFGYVHPLPWLEPIASQPQEDIVHELSLFKMVLPKIPGKAPWLMTLATQ